MASRWSASATGATSIRPIKISWRDLPPIDNDSDAVALRSSMKSCAAKRSSADLLSARTTRVYRLSVKDPEQELGCFGAGIISQLDCALTTAQAKETAH